MATISKRNGTYRIRVSCGYDSTGKQLIKSTTYKPAPSMTKKQIEKELNRQATLFEEQCQTGLYSQQGNTKLSDFIPQYLDIVKSTGTLSPTTLVSYERVIEVYIIPALGHIKLSDIKPIHVQRFIQQLTDDVVSTGKRGAGNMLSPATVRRYYVVLQSILGRASKLGLIAFNPASSEKIDLPPIRQKEVDIFTKEDMAKIITALNNEATIYQALIHLAITTGARRGELLALKWDCIDLDNLTVKIKHSNYRLTGEETKTKSTKNNKQRTVSIPDYCAEILKAHKSNQLEKRFQVGDQWQNQDWVFTQWNGTPMEINTPSHWFKKFLKKNNIPHCKFHALRHTSATLLLAKGINIKTVSSRLGHSQLSTTNIYLHNIEEAEREAASSFTDILNIKKQA